MARLVTNPPRPVVRIKCSPKNFKAVLALATTVSAGLTGHAGFYPSPNPTLIAFNANISLLKTAVATLGTKTNKGGSAALAACKNASLVVYDNLVQLRNYVSNIVIAANGTPALQASQIAWSGFAAKSPKSVIDRLQFVRNGKLNNNKKFPVTLGRISWKKSLGLYKGVKIAGYNVYVAGIYVGSTTKTNYTLPAVTANTLHTVTVKPFNPRGEGNGFTFTVTQMAP